VALAAPGGEIAWTKDYTRAFADAQERQAPLLVHFRGASCEHPSAPLNPLESGRRPDGYQSQLGDCDLMQHDVFENTLVVGLAGRYVSVLVGPGDETLNTRYQVVVNPTTLFLDPWGNEIFRVAGYLERAKFSRILQAVPADFKDLAPAGRALQKRSDDPRALMAAAAFYEATGLRQVSERLYEQAAGPPTAGDPAARRQAAMARGLNLMLMGRGPDAARVFEHALEEGPDKPGSDALLLGLVNAHLTAGKRKDADAAYARLSRQFPDSPYTRKARENLDAAKK